MISKASGDARFPVTRWSAVAAATSREDRERHRGLDAIVRAYWRPIYTYVRLRFRRPREEAQDLTQEFFAHLVERRVLDDFDPDRARLRTFLRVCVDGLVQNHDRASRAKKRGGGALHLSLDFAAADAAIAGRDPVDDVTPELLFEREWTRSFFALAIDSLREECDRQGKLVHFALLEAVDLRDGDERPAYAELAITHGISVSNVTNWLSWARRELRRITLERLRELTHDDAEFRREARALLGVEPS